VDGPTTEGQVAAGLPIRVGDRDNGVTKAMILVWYVAALVFGAAVAGVSWLRLNGRLDPASLLGLARRRR
jgi:hypothetical protein